MSCLTSCATGATFNGAPRSYAAAIAAIPLMVLTVLALTALCSSLATSSLWQRVSPRRKSQQSFNLSAAPHDTGIKVTELRSPPLLPSEGALATDGLHLLQGQLPCYRASLLTVQIQPDLVFGGGQPFWEPTPLQPHRLPAAQRRQG